MMPPLLGYPINLFQKIGHHESGSKQTLKERPTGGRLARSIDDSERKGKLRK
jgi:hypothetical protein